MAANPQTNSQARARRLAKVLLLLALAGVALHTSLSFAADAERRASGETHDRLIMLADGARVPSALPSLRYTRSTTLAERGAGVIEVVKPGDLALVDTTGLGGSRPVTIYLTNLAALRRGYASFLLPIAVWQVGPAGGRWSRAAGVPSSFISDSVGSVSFTLPAGRYYDITLERGGSLVRLPGATAVAPSLYATLA